MCRKQPTPTDILDNQNLTELDKIVFLYIRPRVRNSDGVCNFEQAGKQYRVELKRGQCIVKVAYLAELLQRDRKTIHKSLESLSKWYSEMDNKGMPYGCLITWLHYDSLVSMDNETDNRRTIEGQGRDNDGTANKSDKIVKNKKEGKEKNRYGKFENVLLSDIELFKLQEMYADRSEKIETLSEGIESKGYKYKSHYATILSRDRKNRPKLPDIPKLEPASGKEKGELYVRIGRKKYTELFGLERAAEANKFKNIYGLDNQEGN